MKIQIFDSISELPKIARQAWDQLNQGRFPFCRSDFLEALELHNCVGDRTGWMPRYLTAWQNQNLVGAFILYVKTNSYGEFIFDFAWAQAHESYGFPYYPKLISAIPFTPATGPKLLVSPELPLEVAASVRAALLEAALSLYSESDASSLHALFLSEAETESFQKSGFFIRHSFQYHWRNNFYKTFEDFLIELRSKRRREIVRERKQVQSSGVRIQRLTGAELKPEHAAWMFQFYESTVTKMGGYAYLTPGFFQELFQRLKDNVLFVLATDREGYPVAGALNLFDDHALYGRHWGCVDEYKGMHFEVCYYQGIEFAIEKNLQLFEAGAQGEHKFQRGFLPSLTYSVHLVKEPRLDPAIRDFVEREKKQIADLFEEYKEHNPFQRSPHQGPAEPEVI